MKARAVPLNDLRMDATEFERTMRQALQVEPMVETTVEQKKYKNVSRKKHKRKSA